KRPHADIAARQFLLVTAASIKMHSLFCRDTFVQNGVIFDMNIALHLRRIYLCTCTIPETRNGT
uniref:hypothetical protein n=1 Tax=Yoonia sp. TaxID=2212373 RepID=UPI0040489712